MARSDTVSPPARLDLRFRTPGKPRRVARETAGYRIEHVATLQGAAYDFAWDGARAYLAWHDIILDDGEMSGDDLSVVRGRDLRNRLTCFPKGMRVRGWSAPRARDNAFTALYFDDDWVAGQLEVANVRFRLETYFVDERLSELMRQITSALHQGSPPRALCDSLALVTANILVGRTERPAAGMLSRSQLDRATQFIEAHLHEDVGLDQIAAAAGLSTFHFARAFKRSTGKAPYRQLIESRVARAKLLLAAGDQPLAEVARMTGFASASHFARSFSAIAGQTPSTFRKAARAK